MGSYRGLDFQILISALSTAEDHDAERLLSYVIDYAYSLGLEGTEEKTILYVTENNLDGMKGYLYLPLYTRLDDINWESVHIKEGKDLFSDQLLRVSTDQEFRLVAHPLYGAPFIIREVRWYMDRFFMD